MSIAAGSDVLIEHYVLWISITSAQKRQWIGF